MRYFEICLDRPLNYDLTGKSTPHGEWVHLKRDSMPNYELMVVTDGTINIANGREEFEAKTGDFLIFPPDSPQFGTKPSVCQFYWLHFMPYHELRITEKPSVRSGDNPYILSLPEFGKVKNLEKLIIQMKQLQDSIRSYNDPVQNDYMTSSILCELYNQTVSTAPGLAVFKRQQLYNDMIDYIKWFDYKNVMVSELARHFGYNEKYLSHMFCSLSGVSLKQYILREKMERAKFLLTDTNDPVRRVAEQLGYTDSHNFMKAFKKMTGVTPSEYRNTYSKRMLNMHYENIDSNDR